MSHGERTSERTEDREVPGYREALARLGESVWLSLMNFGLFMYYVGYLTIIFMVWAGYLFWKVLEFLSRMFDENDPENKVKKDGKRRRRTGKTAGQRTKLPKRDKKGRRR